MDPSIIGYCTMEDGTAVPYLLSEGLPAWSREAQELRSSDRTQGQSSADAGTVPMQEGGDGGSPKGSTSPSDSQAPPHAEQSVGAGGDGAPPPTAPRAGEESAADGSSKPSGEGVAASRQPSPAHSEDTQEGDADASVPPPRQEGGGSSNEEQ